MTRAVRSSVQPHAASLLPLRTGRFREYIVIYEAGRSNGTVKRPGTLFVRSAAANLGQRLQINWDELSEQYLRTLLTG